MSYKNYARNYQNLGSLFPPNNQMEKIIVRHIRKDSTYPILIGRGILSQLKEMNIVQMASSVVVISDENVSLHWKVPIVKILKNKKIRHSKHWEASGKKCWKME